MFYCSPFETFLCMYDHIFLQNDVLAFSFSMLKIKIKNTVHTAFLFYLLKIVLLSQNNVIF